MRNPLTELRKSILHLIEESQTPLSAGSIHKLCAQNVNLSTVYRALQYLTKKNLVRRLTLQNGILLYHGKNKHFHFLICLECQEVRSFQDCNAHLLKDKIANEFDYEIDGHIFYFTGLCRDCRNYLNKLNEK